MKQGENAYSDEQYDHALDLAIQKAEDYLQPFSSMIWEKSMRLSGTAKRMAD